MLRRQLAGCACSSAAFWRSSALTAPPCQLSASRAGLGVGEDVLLAFLHGVEDAPRDGVRGSLDDVQVPDHVGVHRAGQDGVNLHAPAGQKGAQRLGHVERGRLGERVGRSERYRGQGRERHVVDDGSPGADQQGQERLCHLICAEQVDG